MTKKRILVAMSGGVDSSVTAALLVEAGHEVVGATMKTFCYDETPGHSRTCCGLDGIMDARRVADGLGIAHYVFDVEKEFTRDVIDDFVAEYAQGRTPNPCVRCNSNTKFGDLLRRGRALGCDTIATGHYVRSGVGPRGETALYRGRDRDKDQAYFLWGLPSELLDLLHFPLGDLTKSQVRQRARDLDLLTAEKPESQEICFVPTGDYRDLLKTRLRKRHPALEPGPVVDLDGRTVGEHDGYAGFTVGQRKGLGGGFSEPHFVIRVDPERRAVVVGPRWALESRWVEVNDLNWFHAAPSEGEEVQVQIRHRARPVEARIRDQESGELSLELMEPQRAVTPGQSCAVFRGEQLLGGGRIVKGVSAVDHSARQGGTTKATPAQ